MLRRIVIEDRGIEQEESRILAVGVLPEYTERTYRDSSSLHIICDLPMRIGLEEVGDG